LVCKHDSHVIKIPKADWSRVKNKQLTATLLEGTPLSYVVIVVVVVVVVVVDIDAQAACDATVATPGEW